MSHSHQESPFLPSDNNKATIAAPTLISASTATFFDYLPEVVPEEESVAPNDPITGGENPSEDEGKSH
jgi:hypothetical protein